MSEIAASSFYIKEPLITPRLVQKIEIPGFSYLMDQRMEDYRFSQEKKLMNYLFLSL